MPKRNACATVPPNAGTESRVGWRRDLMCDEQGPLLDDVPCRAQGTCARPPAGPRDARDIVFVLR